jgi:sugar phosphate isomerase/epimerase
MKSLLYTFVLALFLASNQTTRADGGPSLGLQTWTCRNMTFEQVVDFAVAHRITKLEFIATHLDPAAPKEETLRKKAVLDAHGLVAYSFGVNKTSLDEAANRSLFEFARLMGIKLIIVEPKDLAEWDGLEKLVKEYDIKLAIHNHGRGTTYGDPAVVKKVLAARDSRIGVCLDLGWITAAGFDAAQIFRDYGNRVFDLHFKDKRAEKSGDQTVWIDTEMGQGQANLSGVFEAIKKSGWSGVMAVETDSKAFASDPHPLVTSASAYFSKHSQ